MAQHPQVIVKVLESRDLYNPYVYFRNNSKYKAYVKAELQGKDKSTDYATAVPTNALLPPWNKDLILPVDLKKLEKKYGELVLGIDIFGQGELLAKVSIQIRNLQDEVPFDNWFPLRQGYVHIIVIRQGLNEYFQKQQIVAAVPPQPFPTAQQVQAQQQQRIANAQPFPTALPAQVPNHPISAYPAPAASAPPQNPSAPPPLPQKTAAPTPTPTPTPAPQPQQAPVSAMYPDLVNISYTPSVMPSAPPSEQLAALSMSNPSTPSMSQQSTSHSQPTAPPSEHNHSKAPSLPPKVPLPEDVERKTVCVDFGFATQPVTEEVLTNYFKFCGDVGRIVKDNRYALVGFEKDFEADTAILLEGGIVAGGPIHVFRYKNFKENVPEANRKSVESLAKAYLNDVVHSPLVGNGTHKKEDVSNVTLSEDVVKNTLSSVFVSNLSLQADAKVLKDFFSYCGVVKQIEVYGSQVSGRSDSGCAKVVFGNAETATTALLLDGGFIVDRPIEVHPLTPEAEKKIKNQTPTSQDNVASADDSGAPRSKLSVIASLKSAGYNVGTKAASQARKFDETHFAGRVTQGLGYAKDKATVAKDKLVSWWKG